jgi:hypothetical protein
MSQPDDSTAPPSPEDGLPEGSDPASGRYRIRAGHPVDPDEGVHPEMREPGGQSPAAAVPASPADLIAMQEHGRSALPQKAERQPSTRVNQLLDQLDQLETTAAEDLEIVIRLVRRLEGFHDEVVEELRADTEASHSQLIAWAIDADRLMRARMLLESIDLE